VYREEKGDSVASSGKSYDCLSPGVVKSAMGGGGGGGGGIEEDPGKVSGYRLEVMNRTRIVLETGRGWGGRGGESG